MSATNQSVLASIILKGTGLGNSRVDEERPVNGGEDRLDKTELLDHDDVVLVAAVLFTRVTAL